MLYIDIGQWEHTYVVRNTIRQFGAGANSLITSCLTYLSLRVLLASIWSVTSKPSLPTASTSTSITDGCTALSGFAASRFRREDMCGCAGHPRHASKQTSYLTFIRTSVSHNSLKSPPISLILIYLSSSRQCQNAHTICGEILRLFLYGCFL